MSLHVIYDLAPSPNQKPWLCLCLKLCAMCIPDMGCCIFVLLCAPSQVVAYNVAKVQNIDCIASSLKVFWYGYGSMEWNGEENFSMEWKIFSMEWNGRTLPVWNMEKSSSIAFHTMPWPSGVIC